MIVSDWWVGEQVAAAWVRRFGWEDAEVTPDGRDNGIDVWARGAVAQVKIWRHKKAGIAEVQRLAGSAKPGQSCLFFSADGYTRAALVWSYHPDHRVALFELLLDGRLVACNWHAWRIAQEAPFRLPYAVRQPLLRIGRKLMVGSGLFLLADAVLLIWLTALALIRGALATSTGAGFVAWLAVVDIALLGSVSYALRPEARRFTLAAQRYRETRSWAEWRQAFKDEPPDRDAGTPPDLFVGFQLHWLMRLQFLREDLGWWWRCIRRWAASRFRGSH